MRRADVDVIGSLFLEFFDLGAVRFRRRNPDVVRSPGPLTRLALHDDRADHETSDENGAADRQQVPAAGFLFLLGPAPFLGLTACLLLL